MSSGVGAYWLGMYGSALVARGQEDAGWQNAGEEEYGGGDGGCHHAREVGGEFGGGLSRECCSGFGGRGGGNNCDCQDESGYGVEEGQDGPKAEEAGGRGGRRCWP